MRHFWLAWGFRNEGENAHLVAHWEFRWYGRKSRQFLGRPWMWPLRVVRKAS